MELDIYQIDAFTDTLFGGNPAAVIPLSAWLPNKVLQNLAVENNLAETAFFVPIEENRFHLRWFTPEIEMDLCGHATLATAFVLFEELDFAGKELVFDSQSGPLTVKKKGDFLELNLPARAPKRAELPEIIKQGLNIQAQEVWKARDYLLVYQDEQQIIDIVPNEALLNKINIDPGGIIVTARGKEVDFVSRFFTPQASIFEDPVTGSAHCTLVPFWAERLNKVDLEAIQLSQRRGALFCTLEKDRVYLKGKAVKYLQGKISLP